MSDVGVITAAPPHVRTNFVREYHNPFIGRISNKPSMTAVKSVAANSDSFIKATDSISEVAIFGDTVKPVAELPISGENWNYQVVAPPQELYAQVCVILPDLTYIQFMKRLGLHLTVIGDFI